MQDVTGRLNVVVDTRLVAPGEIERQMRRLKGELESLQGAIKMLELVDGDLKSL